MSADSRAGQQSNNSGGGHGNSNNSTSPLVGRRRPINNQQMPPHQARGSIDLSTFDSPLVNRTRPSSEIFLQTPHKLLQPDAQPAPPLQYGNNNPYYANSNNSSNMMAGNGGGGYHSPMASLGGGQQQPQFTQQQPQQQPQHRNIPNLNGMPGTNNHNGEMDQAAEKWLADLELYQGTLEEMAAVSLDKNFKDELSAIEQWFSVLSVGERTAALYALLQQTTPVQIRFFITVLQKLSNKDPYSAVLSPSTATNNNPEQTPLQNQLSQAQAQAAQAQAQVHQQLNQQSPIIINNSNNTANESDTIFNKGAAGSSSPLMTPSNSNPNRSSLQPPRSPWTNSHEINRPKSATDNHLQQEISNNNNNLNTPASKHTKSYSQTPQDFNNTGNFIFPETSASWASMMNTPASNFNSPQVNNSGGKINNEIASSTAMKLAALSTVNGRVVLDDVKKQRRKHHIVGDLGDESDNNNSSSSELMGGLGLTVPTATAQQQQNNTTAAATPDKSSNRNNNSTPPSSSSKSNNNNNATSSSKEVNYTDINLLQDIPSWLRSLRLHKYTDNLKDLEWKELISLSDDDLQDRGVSALGARRKMLKIFDHIKQAYNI